jgi:putative glutamine amidotransferase
LRDLRGHAEPARRAAAGVSGYCGAMARPVIGICTPIERARVGDARRPDDLFVLPRSFVDSVHRAGGSALLLVPDPALTAEPDDVLDMIDGLMLAGGADVEPASYGADRHPLTVETDPRRDAFEVALVRRAIERDLPVLGICRGMQVMNVACGGTLHQDLPELLHHEHHRRVSGSFDGAEHDVRLLPGSLAARAAGEERHTTRSHHHQGVDRVGDGLKATGWADVDGLVEAIEEPGGRFALGVQWHPEADERSRLIAALVEEAAAVRDAAG